MASEQAQKNFYIQTRSSSSSRKEEGEQKNDLKTKLKEHLVNKFTRNARQHKKKNRSFNYVLRVCDCKSQYNQQKKHATKLFLISMDACTHFISSTL